MKRSAPFISPTAHRPWCRQFVTAATLLATVLGATALAGYNADPVIKEITAQALAVNPKTVPLAAGQLATLLPHSCAGAVASNLKQATGHAEAHYAGISVMLDDFGPNAMNTVMGAAQFLGLYEGGRGSVLVRPLSGAVGYSIYQADQRSAQTRVWVRGRYVVQITQMAARSRSEVDACLKAIRLNALPSR